MDDTISRQAAIDAIRAFYDEYIVYDNGKSIEDLISELPSAQRKGKWMDGKIYEYSGTYWYIYCSECHYERQDDDHGKDDEYIFCPHCGAKMERGEDG